ncbi:MAG TPA: hemolysin family protein [Candidatus Acidoferrales bacterium]|nr:hemolysin family protein [Candidatus Acidoferrales bacterium]
MSVGLAVILIALFALLTFVSYAARLYTEAGKFLSREFQENIDVFEQQIEPRLGVDRSRAALSLALLEQLTTGAIAFLLAFSVFAQSRWTMESVLQSVLFLVLSVVIFHRFLPYLFFSRTRGLWFVPFTFFLRGLIYATLPITLILSFIQGVISLTRADNATEEPEHPSEAVDALIEAGQDEGILEESDRDLIHSVVEFGDKTVREVMTPRPSIVAVPEGTTIDQLSHVLNEHPYSRLPVYRGNIDHIVGILNVRDLLQVADAEASHRTVAELMKTDVMFVPETKRANEFLAELQRSNVHLAIVIDEYGGVAGLVSVEDLVEEIVGELRDEREAKSEVQRESDTCYVVPGALDVDNLRQIFDTRLGDYEATSVGGLVTEIAGHIPAAGEFFERDGLRFEVVQATSRRVERVRVCLALPGGQTTPANGTAV